MMMTEPTESENNDSISDISYHAHGDISNANVLFPVFLKLEDLRVLVIGGGAVGAEKLEAIFKNSPATKVRLVCLKASAHTIEVCQIHQVDLQFKPYLESDLSYADLVIAATGDTALSRQIRNDCRARGLLVNVADTPELCDFYLGSVMTKGDLKIAVSTNGKSPTMARRIRETLEASIPDAVQLSLDQLNAIRKSLSGDFAAKVDRLNELTDGLRPTSIVASEDSLTGRAELNQDSKPGWVSLYGRYAWWLGFAFFFMVLGGLVLKIPLINNLADRIVKQAQNMDIKFYWMIITGFAAQIIAGALGMGYGVLCTTILLSLGISLPAISSSIHTAETFASGISGFSHYKFGNVNRKLFRSLLIPGVAGAILGAVILSRYGDKYALYIRPVLAFYTLFLGMKILLNAFQKTIKKAKVKRIPLLGLAGGFIDSFGGGGWGPLITSSFIAHGRKPRFVVGSVSLAKFFVSAASALTFFAILGINGNWQIIAGLLIGGVTAAPLSARLAGLLPNKSMFISVGILVILCSIRLLYISLPKILHFA